MKVNISKLKRFRENNNRPSMYLKVCLVALVLAVATSSCELLDEDVKLCVSKGDFETLAGGRVYAAGCLQDSYQSCGSNFVQVKTYNSKKSCEAEKDYYAKNGPNADGPGSSSSAMCSGGYVNPKGGDIQTNVYCEMAHGFICKAGFSPSAKEVKEQCDIFKMWQKDNPKLENCKYCQ